MSRKSSISWRYRLRLTLGPVRSAARLSRGLSMSDGTCDLIRAISHTIANSARRNLREAICCRGTSTRIMVQQKGMTGRGLVELPVQRSRRGGSPNSSRLSSHCRVPWVPVIARHSQTFRRRRLDFSSRTTWMLNNYHTTCKRRCPISHFSKYRSMAMLPVNRVHTRCQTLPLCHLQPRQQTH